MRLFAAIVPPEEVLDSLEAAVLRSGAHSADDAAVRWNARELWHLTVAFYGDDDLPARTLRLGERLRGIPAPRLRVVGAGTFPGVLWAGIAGDTASDSAAVEVVAAAGTGDDRLPFHPHLTIARWRGRRRPPAIGRVADALADYAGPSWVAHEVVLFGSELSHHGPSYTAQRHFPLAE
ncbi:MAG: RNA 2',3'-cyclic phosphodiesterase [Actinophytocola sp.]|nr:RNA 2',3'-cyclic phosphodiesterase [Actinophytocola sp.]